MPTAGERLAALEETVRSNTRRIDKLHDDIHGGPSVEWRQSVRGKQHDMAQTQATAGKLEEVAQAVASASKAQQRSRLTRWQWIYLALCATAAAAAPYVVLLTH